MNTSGTNSRTAASAPAVACFRMMRSIVEGGPLFLSWLKRPARYRAIGASVVPSAMKDANAIV